MGTDDRTEDMELAREPIQYSRLLVFVGLVPILLADITVGLPAGVFVAAGGIVFATAAGVHAVGGEYRATAAWVLFGVALALVALVDVTANPAVLAVFVVSLVGGLLLLASQRLEQLR